MEPTLPAERTRLAWQRTILAGVVCLLVVLRLLAEVSVPLVVAAAIVGLLVGGAAVSTSIRRAVRGRDLTADTSIGRNALLLSVLVSLTCVTAMAYVLLA